MVRASTIALTMLSAVSCSGFAATGIVASGRGSIARLGAAQLATRTGAVRRLGLRGGGEKMGKDYDSEMLGSLPLDIHIREQADSGRPTVVADPDGEIAGIYKSVARQVAIKIAAKAKDYSSKFPSISISKAT